MKRLMLLSPLLLMPLMGCRTSPSRTQETLVREAIFVVQRVTDKVEKADDYEMLVNLEGEFRNETEKLRQLKAELEGMAEPSSWERSRMRKHNQLAEKVLAEWSTVETILRDDLQAGAVPPHVRIKLLQAMDEFTSARVDMWKTMMAIWE